jgi:metal-responsive CopG/Arc/MetJ family transcriptional regulator
MSTVQMTIDDALLAQVDRLVRKLGTTRSEFTREALRRALEYQREKEQERRHREGYLRKPVRSEEFCVCEDDLAWPEP